MRCAVFAATSRGVESAVRLKDGLMSDAVDIFLKVRRETEVPAKRFSRLADAVAEAFRQYDALIFFMAAGIAVRMIAPHLKSKLTDPAVLVADERGGHIISLLSGHVGGGNGLTRRVADCLGGIPIITTATDVNGLISPDALGAELGLRPVPKPMIQEISGALLEGKDVLYAIDEQLPRHDFFESALSKRGIPVARISASDALAAKGRTVFITADESLRSEQLLCLVPRRLIAGMGCRRGVPKDVLKAALSDACARIGQEISAVSIIASAAVKKDEAGLLALAAELGAEARFFETADLQQKIEAYGLEESEFVRRQIGAGNVSEAAALCCVEQGRIALPKTKWEKATVALVWEK